MELDFLDFLLKVAAAVIAGFLIGFERQAKGKRAGLKTNSLVTLGSCVFVLIAKQYEGEEFIDMTRILGQIVVGVGFLGAGVIFQREGQKSVKGLATAATIWCGAAAGCLAAYGLYLPLLAFTIIIVTINLVFGYLNNKVRKENVE